MNKKTLRPVLIALLLLIAFVLLNHFLAPRVISIAGSEIVTTFAFLCLVAILICFLLVIRVCRLTAKTIFFSLLISGFLYQGWYWFTLFAESMEYKNDYGSCSAEIKLLEANGLTVPSVVDSPIHSAAYCFKGHVGVFLEPYQYIQVYSLQDKKKQSDAIRLLTQFPRTKGVPPTVLVMYGQENWIKDGHGGGTRGPEPVLRTYVIR